MKDSARLKLFLATICLGLLLGLAFSYELWFPVARTFPRAPLFFALPKGVEALVERLLSAGLALSLILTFFFRRPKISLAAAICSLLLLAFFDQTRMQPWTYEYLLILIVFYFHDRETTDETGARRTLGLAQLVIAGIYVWSGVQKMNFNFSHEVLPALLAPELFPAVPIPFGLLGIVIPSLEALIGAGLLFRRTRSAAVCLAAAMHLTILGVLIAKNYNSIVWFWNLTLIFAVVFAFWKSDVPLREIVETERLSGRKLIVLAAVSLPVLNFFGYWDSFLSGAYYSGNAEIPAIRVSDEVFEKLPPTARSAVFRTKTAGEKILPPLEWSLADTNAPVYPEERVFRRVLLEVCRLANDKSQIELIIRKRPAILDGSHRLKRIGCAETE